VDKKTKKIIKKVYKKISEEKPTDQNFIQNVFYEMNGQINSVKDILEQHVSSNLNFKKYFLNSKKEFIISKNQNRINNLFETHQSIQNNLYSLHRVIDSLEYTRAKLVERTYNSNDKKINSKKFSNVIIELSSLEKIYNKKFEFKESHINITSENISLTDTKKTTWDLGSFTINLPLETIFNDSINNSQKYFVTANEPNACASDESITHPHVRDEWLCEGEAKVAIAAALKQGRLVDFFDMIMGILNTYGYDNPYAKLEAWDVTEECCECGGHVYDDSRTICGCDAILCEDCGSCCSVCDNVMCSECNYTCDHCNTHLCDGCRERCSSCRSYYCPDCITTCDSCDYKYCNDCADSCHECGETICPNCNNVCSDCNETFCSDCCYHCNDCGDVVCGKCAKKCKCEEIFCESCSEKCSDCGEIICKHCSSSCNECSEKYCEDCLEEDVCSKCQKAKEIENDTTSST
jgi:hypothetical protein